MGADSRVEQGVERTATMFIRHNKPIPYTQTRIYAAAAEAEKLMVEAKAAGDYARHVQIMDDLENQFTSIMEEDKNETPIMDETRKIKQLAREKHASDPNGVPVTSPTFPGRVLHPYVLSTIKESTDKRALEDMIRGNEYGKSHKINEANLEVKFAKLEMDMERKSHERELAQKRKEVDELIAKNGDWNVRANDTLGMVFDQFKRILGAPAAGDLKGVEEAPSDDHFKMLQEMAETLYEFDSMTISARVYAFAQKLMTQPQKQENPNNPQNQNQE